MLIRKKIFDEKGGEQSRDRIPLTTFYLGIFYYFYFYVRLCPQNFLGKEKCIFCWEVNLCLSSFSPYGRKNYNMKQNLHNNPSKGMPKNLGTVFQICEDFIKKSQENNIIKNLDFSFHLLCTYRIYKRVQYVRSVSRRLFIVYLTTIYANTWISQISLRKPKKALLHRIILFIKGQGWVFHNSKLSSFLRDSVTRLFSPLFSLN